MSKIGIAVFNLLFVPFLLLAEDGNPGIGIPDGCYASPEAGCVVPVGKQVRFKGLSSGNPSEWTWTFEGGELAKISGQDAEVVFEKEGRYNVGLTIVDNGVERMVTLDGGVLAGGTHEVWNIQYSERELLSSVPLDISWYGYYAGSNVYGNAFAEKFEKPATNAVINGVCVYFASTVHISEEAVIEVSICPANKYGLPSDNYMETASLPVAELIPYDSGMPTIFEFEKPVAVDDEFFVVISGIPCAMRGMSADEIAILCGPDRGEEGLSTVYSHIDYENQNYWRKDSDRHLSMAVAPVISFEKGDDVQGEVFEINDNAGLKYDGNEIISDGKYECISIYDLCGNDVLKVICPSGRIALDKLQPGIYVAVAWRDGVADVLKLMKR